MNNVDRELDFVELKRNCEKKTKDKLRIELAYRIDQLSNPEKWIMNNEWYYEPKYDGIRCILYDGCPTSRYGNTLNFPYLFDVRLSSEFEDFCIDGELFHANPYKTVSVKRYRTELPDLSQFKYYIFDIVPYQTVLAPYKEYTKAYEERRKLLEIVIKALLRDYPKLKQVIRIVPYKKLQTKQKMLENVYELANKYIKDGYEGILLKRAGASYKSKRTRDWIKVKESIDIDADIIDFVRGTGKYRDSLGALIVRPREGQIVKEVFRVGTGFTDIQRQFIWNNREKLTNLPVTVVAQSVTETGKARMPVFKHFRLDLVNDPVNKLGRDTITEMCQIGLARPDDCALVLR